MIGSNFAAFNAGKIETIIVTNIEHAEITNIERKFISEGMVLKKYISSGKRLMLNIVLKNCLKFSTYIEKVTPRIIPKIVAESPMITPIKKNIFTIDLFKTPIDFNIAILSFYFSKYYC